MKGDLNLSFAQMKGDEFLCLFNVSTQAFYTNEIT